MRIAGMLIASVISSASVAFGEPLRTSVTWTDGTGADGRADFQGAVEGDSLSGQLDFDGVKLVVVATIDEDGAAEGTIETASGSQVGSFQTTVVNGELSGDFIVTGFSGGLWQTETSGPRPEIPNVTD